MASIWDQIRDAAAEGKTPYIEVRPAERILPPRRPSGRPKVRGPNGECYHYKMYTPSGHPMQCVRRDCKNRLKADQEDLVCSDQCRELLREYCQLVIDILDKKIPATDFPGHHRSRSIRTKKRHPKRNTSNPFT